MARYVASVEMLWDRERAFDYLAELSDIADWDPIEIDRPRRLGQVEPGTAGAGSA